MSMSAEWRRDLRRADEAEARVRELEAALRRAAYLAENLHGMIGWQTWRDHGGDDGQGHYEGDYRADQIGQEIRSLFAVAAGGAEGSPLGVTAHWSEDSPERQRRAAGGAEGDTP